MSKIAIVGLGCRFPGGIKDAASLRADLRNLVTAEEAFFSDSGKYSQTIDSAHVKFSPSTNVTVVIGTPGTGYWTATATHSQLANVTCGIGMNTTNPTVTTANEGEPACK